MGGTDSRGIALIIRGKNLRFGDDDLSAVCQLLETAVGDHVSGVESLYLGGVGLGDARFDVMHMRDAILNKKNIGHVAIVLDRGGRDENNVLQRVQQQAGVHKLVRKEHVVDVLEQGA